jgi:hypothetical protein
MTACNCVGWWQQKGFGRQPMEQLRISLDGSRVSGSGTDLIAPFTLQGRIREDGSLEMIKQYQQRHSVLYVGVYDGEGHFYGTWDIEGYQGQWAIRILAAGQSESTEIQEILPLSGKSS